MDMSDRELEVRSVRSKCTTTLILGMLVELLVDMTPISGSVKGLKDF
jgi:hypothetical protein